MAGADMTPDLTPEQWRAALAASQRQVADMAAAQEEFLRVVSHDLRAPLRHITSYGKLVREVLGDLPADVLQSPALQEAQEFVGTMEQSARRMALMLDGLLALSRVGRSPLHMQPVALSAAVEKARAALPTAEAAQWSVAADLPTLLADPALTEALDLSRPVGATLASTLMRHPDEAAHAIL